MIGYLKFGAALVVMGLLVGAYFKGRGDGGEKVQSRWDADIAVRSLAFANATAEARRIEADRARAAQEVEDGLKAKLSSAESRVAGLAGRVLAYAARSRDCPMSGDSAAPAEPPNGGGVPDGLAAIKRDLDALGAAAARDSARLTECQLAYERMRAAGIQ